MSIGRHDYYDAIVVGTGIAGMYCALNLDSDKKVLLITKDQIDVSNTELAQGGVAVAFDACDFESHYDDTLKTGNLYNDEKNLKIMVREGADNINTLIKWGVNFDTDKNGNIQFTKEGGHSTRRIIHYKDTTGHEIVRGLVEEVKKRNNIEVLTETFVVDLISHNKRVSGIQVIKGKRHYQIPTNAVILATGGIGEIYDNTTNARVATGDGVAMALRVGARVKDMEFVQFHPTALNVPGHAHFLISEAVRGEGGILRNEAGEAFMPYYHELGDLAPRSIVSRAILEECKKQKNQNIYVDVTHLDKKFILDRFPNIYKECLKRGIKITETLIPIVPVQHYIMGGIVSDDYGRTNVGHLFTCGEVACTGVHGANRMASNSLLEALVFGSRVAEAVNQLEKEPLKLKKDNSLTCQSHISDEDLYAIKKVLQETMNSDVFIFRNKEGLNHAGQVIHELIHKLPKTLCTVEEYELLNMLMVAQVITKSALKRDKSLGSHMIEGGE